MNRTSKAQTRNLGLRLAGFFLIFTVVMILTLLQERMIFLGVPLSESHRYRFEWPHTEFFISTPDGGSINALHFKAKEPRGTIVYYHGNAGNLQRWGEVTSMFPKLGYNLLVMDYRGYGKSRGQRNEELLLEDAIRFYRHAIDQLGYSEEEIIIYGRSLGSSFATYVASVENPARLVLETPFFNLTDVARARFPFLPVDRILRYRFRSDRYISDVRCPITIYHGTGDRVVPHASGYKLFRASESDRISFYSIKGGRHNNLSDFPAYINTIEDVLSGAEWESTLIDKVQTASNHEH